MYKLLIINDEPPIVEWLYDLFNEEKELDIEVYKACSGLEALELLDKTKVDIVLSDIYMPQMDGLQLLEKIRSNWPDCKVIFLTGCTEFDYIYRAIKNDCISYILKTEDDDEIKNVVKKAVDEIDKSMKNQEYMIKAKSQLKDLLPILQNKYLLENLIEAYPTNAVSQERLDDFEIKLIVDNPVFLILGYVDEFPPETNSQGRSLIRQAVKILIEKYLFEYTNKICLDYGRNGHLCIIQSDAEDAHTLVLLKGILETIQTAAKESIGVTVSFILSDEAAAWSRIPEEYSYLKQLLNFSVSIGEEMLLTKKNFSLSAMEPGIITDETIKQSQILLKKIDSFAMYLERGQKEELFRYLTKATEGLKTIKSKNSNIAKEIYFTISNCLLSYINKWKLSEMIAFKIGLYKLMNLESHDTWKDAIEYLFELTEIIFEIQKSSQTSMVESSINNIKKYIENNLNNDLSLIRLGEISAFNPSYLSRLYKNVTGGNLVDFITEKRMERAKKLLEETSMKIQEIVTEVVSDSPTYFGKVFKRITNMTPHEYRDFVQRSK